MNRRESLLALLALGSTPLVIEAQQGRVYRVGVITLGGTYSAAIDGLREGLRELGLEEGKQFVLHVRDTKGDRTLVDAAARSLEEEKVDLVYALGTSVAIAARRATKKVPIVFFAGSDPVALGLIESYRKPGGRLTGVYGQFSDATAKRLELLKAIVPRLARVVTYYDPRNPTAERGVKLARDAARQLKVELIEKPVASVEELRAGLRALRPGEADAFFYVPDAMVTSQSELIVEAANAKRLPTMFGSREYVVQGALAGYGTNLSIIGKLSAKHVQRILLGADPGSLPVELIDRAYFIINLKTARALGLTIPQSVLVRADEVLQ